MKVYESFHIGLTSAERCHSILHLLSNREAGAPLELAIPGFNSDMIVKNEKGHLRL
jgi:hypothetical protein